MYIQIKKYRLCQIQQPVHAFKRNAVRSIEHCRNVSQKNGNGLSIAAAAHWCFLTPAFI